MNSKMFKVETSGEQMALLTKKKSPLNLMLSALLICAHSPALSQAQEVPPPVPQQEPAPVPAPDQTPPAPVPAAPVPTSSEAAPPPAVPSPQSNPVIHKPSCPVQTNFNFGENDLLAVNLHQLSCLVAQLKPIEAKEAFLGATLGYMPIKDRGNLVATVKIGKQFLSTFTLGTLLDLTSNHIESIELVRRYLGAHSSEDIARSFMENIPPEDQIKMQKNAEARAAISKVVQDLVAGGMSQADAEKLLTTPPTSPTPQQPQGDPKSDNSQPAQAGQPAQPELTDEQIKEQTNMMLLQIFTQYLSTLEPGQLAYNGVTLRITFKDGSNIVIHLKNAPETDAIRLFNAHDKAKITYRANQKNHYFVGVQIAPASIPKHWQDQPILSEGWKKTEGLGGITTRTSSTFIGIRSAQVSQDSNVDVFSMNRYEFRLFYGYMPFEFTAEPWKDNYGRNWIQNLFFSDDE